VTAARTPTGIRAPLSGHFRYWFDDGRGGCWIYGEIRSVGHKFLTVDFDNGRRQRVRINSAAHNCMESMLPKSVAALAAAKGAA
jgi:hypothetical protein